MTNDLGVWFPTEALSGEQAAGFAERVEALGYSTLWIGETFGRDPFAHIAHLAHAAKTLRFATGIANVYNRHPGVMKQAANTLAEQTGGRFTLGLGVSSPAIVERQRGLDYSRPLRYISTYLDDYEAALYMSVEPPSPVKVVLAAVGPKMLALAGERSAGAHTYNISPAHTAMAREILGEGPELLVEQKVLLCTEPAKAREAAAKALKFYLRAPGYRRGWNRLGFSDEQIDSFDDGFVDAIVAWGDEAALRRRVDEHFAAGATHVCIQPVDPGQSFGQPDWDALEALAPG